MSYFIIIRGPLGSGKTTIADKVAEKINAKHFDVDKVLEDNDLYTEEEEGYVSQKDFLKANSLVIDEAREALQKGQPVIFDSNFYWKSQIEDLIEKLDFPHFEFTLNAPLDVCIKRDENRKVSQGKDAAIVVHEKTSEFTYGVEIDTTKGIGESVDEIVLYLPEKRE
jgi:predicted kinase